MKLESMASVSPLSCRGAASRGGETHLDPCGDSLILPTVREKTEKVQTAARTTEPTSVRGQFVDAASLKENFIPPLFHYTRLQNSTGLDFYRSTERIFSLAIQLNLERRAVQCLLINGMVDVQWICALNNHRQGVCSQLTDARWRY